MKIILTDIPASEIEQNKQIIKQQTRELGENLSLKLTCGGCGKTMRLIRAFRCYLCGIYFCDTCAAKHFGKKRPVMCIPKEYENDN